MRYLRYHRPGGGIPHPRRHRTPTAADDQAQDHALRHALAARRRQAGPRHRRARDADPPDGIVRLSRTAITRPRCSTWSGRDTSTRAFPIRPARCSRSGSPRSKAASARSRRRADRRRCTSRSPRCSGAGAHIVASRALYGGSHNLLDYTLPRFGIETTFVAPRDVDAWRAAIRPNTRLLFGETLGNPGLDVLDVPRVADLAHEHGLPLLVDSTFTTPYLMQPVRPRRRSRLPLRDEIPVRPRHRHRRPPRRFRALRLGRSRGAREVPDADRTVRGLPRHGVRRGVDDRRLPAAGAARGHPRLRRVHVAVHGVRDPAGHRDAAAANGAPCRERAQGRGVSRRPSAGGSRRLSGAPRAPRPRARAAAAAAGLRRRSSASTSRARARRAGNSSRRWRSSRTSPTSATRNRW